MKIVFILLAAICSIRSSGFENPKDEFVNNLSKNIELIALGDPTHTEGTITTYRVELIKKLVLEKGFNVIAFESNLFQMYDANRRFDSTGEPGAIFHGMLGLFPCEEFYELFEFIKEQKSKGNPVKIIGFDPKFSGWGVFNNLKGRLEEKFFIKNLFSDSQKNEYLYLLGKLMKHSLYDMNIKKDARYTFKKLNNIIISNLDSIEDKDEETKVIIQTLRNFNGESDRLVLRGMDNFNRRDSFMFETTKFLKDELYKGQKIILWGSSTHLYKSPDGIYNKFHSRGNRHSMGEFVNKYYPGKYYFLAYSAINGRKTNLIYKRKIKKPSEGDIEYIAMQQMEGKDDYYLNLNANKSSSPLMPIPEVLPSKIFGHTRYSKSKRCL